MTKILLSLATLLAMSPLAQAAFDLSAPLSFKSARAIANDQARGDEVFLSKGVITPHTAQGGLGSFIKGWDIVLEFTSRVGVPHVNLKELGGQPNGRDLILYDAVLEDLQDGHYRLSSQCSGPGFYELEILSPARFVQIPDLNSPTPGWVGPKFGVTDIKFTQLDE